MWGRGCSWTDEPERPRLTAVPNTPVSAPATPLATAVSVQLCTQESVNIPNRLTDGSQEWECTQAEGFPRLMRRCPREGTREGSEWPGHTRCTDASPGARATSAARVSPNSDDLAEVADVATAGSPPPAPLNPPSLRAARTLLALLGAPLRLLRHVELVWRGRGRPSRDVLGPRRDGSTEPGSNWRRPSRRRKGSPPRRARRRGRPPRIRKASGSSSSTA